MAYVRRRSGPVRHPFVEDPDWPGDCVRCNLPEGNAIHELPHRTDEQREHEQRKTGER